MREQRGGIQAIAAGRRGIAVAISHLRTELDEQIRGREPLHLHAFLPRLPAKHGLVDERLIDEIPRMGVHLVEIAETRKEPADFSREPIGQCRGAHECLFHFDFVFAGDGRGQLTCKVRIDAGRECELGFAEIEAPFTGPTSPPLGGKPAMFQSSGLREVLV